MIAQVEQYLCESDNMKVEVEELELLLGPEDSEIDWRYILGSQRGATGRVLEDARETGGRVPRAQQRHQIQE